jgi:rhamnose utilization protein RhaD (predicted bifunctional aldolase and dehydrogenase)
VQEIDLEFIEVSREIGKDPLFIQGAGGNTSCKVDANTMWVKASGKWLAQAGAEDVFVAVNWAQINRQIEAGFDDPVADATLVKDPRSLRPSIETTLHSLMPHKVVIHTHSVNTIAHAVQHNAEANLSAKLEGLEWAFVPYSKPGLPLTRLVSRVLTEKSANILVIQNHGLVVGGATSHEALSVMREIEARLDVAARPMRKADAAQMEKICANSGYVVAGSDLIHQLALDPQSFEVARNGSLYPDHVVFLGSTIASVDDVAELAVCCAAKSADPLHPKAIALRSVGVVYDSTLSLGGIEMLKALANVVRRIPAGSKIRYLDPEEERELVDWDAEKYRQALP